MKQPIFSAATVLLPTGCSHEQWSVVACDQYTSEPDYWERVFDLVGNAPSTLHCILPEVYFARESDLSERIASINRCMDQYLSSGLFQTIENQYLYLERTLRDGRCRRGLIGKIDLEAYSYASGSRPPVRPTEGTVESRLPPRIKVREHAPIELPHVMMLLDDVGKTVLEPVAKTLSAQEQVYDFSLMEGGGRLRGWALSAQEGARIDEALTALFAQMPQDDGHPMLIAVGDGNHSLATAKACFEAIKAELPEEQWRAHPARWALVELGNLHDEALEFEPIHRIVTAIQPDHLMAALCAACGGEETGAPAQTLTCVTAEQQVELALTRPTSRLTVGTLQQFLDGYLAANGGEIDYIHGADVVARLVENREDAVGFLLPVMQKGELFAAVRADGALPRKTFSMGEAWDKRYYLEARRIK